MRFLEGAIGLICASLVAAIGAGIAQSTVGESWIGFLVTALLGGAVTFLVVKSSRHAVTRPRLRTIPPGLERVRSSLERALDWSAVTLFTVVAGLVSRFIGLGIREITSGLDEPVRLVVTSASFLTAILVMWIPVTFVSAIVATTTNAFTRPDRRWVFPTAAGSLSVIFAAVCLSFSGLFW
jgi:hypothetical protein